MDVTLTYNSTDFSPALSKYEVNMEIEYGKTIKTLDHVEHAAPAIFRPVITFSLKPLSDATANTFYTALRTSIGNATYTGADGIDRTAQFRVMSDLSATFGLRSVDGNRYWKGGEIVLRATSPM